MTIIYHIGDLEFNATDPKGLKAELEKFFSYQGLMPEVEIISDDYVRVDIDDEKIKLAEAKVKLAFDCCNHGNFSSAKEFISGALEICPLHSDAHRTLAQIYMQEGKIDDAIKSCSKALKCNPENMWALILMGNLMLHYRKDKKEALKYYERVLHYYPDNSVALNNVAGVKLGLEQFDEALAIFNKVLSKNSTYANAHYGKVACLEQLGRLEEAFEAARIGCLNAKESPENPGVLRQLFKMQVSLAKRIVEKTDYSSDAIKIKEDLEKKFGVPIEFRADASLPVLGKLRYYKHHGLDKNIVMIRPGDTFTWHYAIHELMHLYFFSTDEKAGVGKIVYSDEEANKRFYNRFAAFFRPLRNRIGEDSFKKFYNQLHSGLASRAMNSPLDLFVEDRIFDNYPHLRPLQLLSLLQQEMDNTKADQTASESKDIPKVIVDASRVMNLVQALQLKENFGIDMTEGHHPSRQEMALAKSLYQEYLAYEETYNVGDEYELMSYFTDNLRLQDLLVIDDDHGSGNDSLLDLDSMLERTPEEKKQEDAFQKANKDGEDPAKTFMMSLFMVQALEYFDGKPAAEVKKIAYDAAMLGVSGISPEKGGYFLPSVPGKEFSGYEMLAWYYVSWAISAPDAVDKLNLPFSAAYLQALTMYKQQKDNGKN